MTWISYVNVEGRDTISYVIVKGRDTLMDVTIKLDRKRHKKSSEKIWELLVMETKRLQRYQLPHKSFSEYLLLRVL